MSELSKIEDETEFEPVDQGEETQETAADDGFEIEVVDDRPIEDRVPPRADPAETVDEDEGEAAQYSERVQKELNNLNMNITKSAEPKKRLIDSVRKRLHLPSKLLTTIKGCAKI